jgi:hypothetical protein
MADSLCDQAARLILIPIQVVQAGLHQSQDDGSRVAFTFRSRSLALLPWPTSVRREGRSVLDEPDSHRTDLQPVTGSSKLEGYWTAASALLSVDTPRGTIFAPIKPGRRACSWRGAVPRRGEERMCQLNYPTPHCPAPSIERSRTQPLPSGHKEYCFASKGTRRGGWSCRPPMELGRRLTGSTSVGNVSRN